MKKKIVNIILILVGSLLLAIGVNTVYVPYEIASGGVTGFAIVLESAFGFGINTTVFVLNGVLLVAALIFIGKDFFIKSLLGSLALPFFMTVVPVEPLTDDLVISLVAGTIFVAIGIKIVYVANGSTGGTTIPPMIFKKYFNFPISRGLLISDGLVVLSSFFVLGLNKSVVATISIIFFVMVYEYIETGIRRARSVHIISKFHREIKEEIFEKLDRGATYLNGHGAYNLEERDVLVVVVGVRELSKLKSICDKHDENAFIIVHNVVDVHGEGFSYFSK